MKTWIIKLEEQITIKIDNKKNRLTWRILQTLHKPHITLTTHIFV